MDRSRGLGVAVSAAGALALAAASPPWSVPWLAPLAVTAFVVSVGARPRNGAMQGVVFGAVFVGSTSWWLAESIAPAAWAALTLVQGLWFGLLGLAVALMRHARGWPALAACAWTAVESARSSWPWGGFPWGRLGYTAVDTPWAPALSVVGVAGTGTLVAFAGAVFASALLAARQRDTSRRRVVGLVASSAGVLAIVSAAPVAGIAAGSLISPADRAPIARIALVQAEVPGSGTDVASNHRAITQTLSAETRALSAGWSRSGGAPELVVWPENATAVDPARDDRARSLLLSAAATAGAPLLAGAITYDTPTSVRNQAIVWTSGGPGPSYTKQHLVPFGEYVPLRPVAERLSARVGAIPRDMTPGLAPAPMRVGDLRIANALCFDVAYDAVIRDQVRQGVDVVVVQTSNAMFLGTAQQEQQWAITRARAIEVGRSVVVSSMNGITGAVSYDGSVLGRLPDSVSGSTVIDVPVSARTTPATSLGPWPARLAWLGAALSQVHAIRRRRDRTATRTILHST